MLKQEFGNKYGRWVVLSFNRVHQRCAYWNCRCICGTEKSVKGYDLRSGQSVSCGCYQKECASRLKALAPGEGAFRQLFSTYRLQAKNREIAFGLTREEFKKLTQSNCHYCGTEPKQVIRRKFGTIYTYNGVDRLNSSKPYSIENCVACCGTHNLMKLGMSVDEFIAACQSVTDFQKAKQ